MFSGQSNKGKPRRNVRLLGQGERRPRREAGFGLKLTWFFFKKFMLVVGLVVLTLAFILGYDFFTQTKLLALTEVELNGNYSINGEELITAAGIETGANLLKLDVGHVRQKLLGHEWVKDVDVSRDLPNKLVIDIIEQDALICADLGQIFIVNNDGFVFKPALAENTLRMPTVRGLHIPAEYWVNAPDFCLWTATRGIPPTEVNKLTALKEFLDLCESNRRVMGLALISDIETDGLTGITVIMRNGRVVKFGFGNLTKKFGNYDRFVSYADKVFTDDGIQVVDLRDVGRIVVKQAGE